MGRGVSRGEEKGRGMIRGEGGEGNTKIEERQNIDLVEHSRRQSIIQNMKE